MCPRWQFAVDLIAAAGAVNNTGYSQLPATRLPGCPTVMNRDWKRAKADNRHHFIVAQVAGSYLLTIVSGPNVP